MKIEGERKIANEWNEMGIVSLKPFIDSIIFIIEVTYVHRAQGGWTKKKRGDLEI